MNNATKNGDKEHNLESNALFYQYEIQPIKGREWIQQHFISLPLKAANYNNRHITLNERISIIERGYRLVPILHERAHTKVRNVRLPQSGSFNVKRVASRTSDDEPVGSTS
uniref:Secreted protein n=1 Tax=Parascaris univalens TaxID=6257 RepID=A0A914ZE34_PARUN